MWTENKWMRRITYFDVEYANARNKTICQIGLHCKDYESGEDIFPPQSLYVNPEDGFDENCIKIHRITPSAVKSAPSFPNVWASIEKFFTNAIIVGHNVAGADLDALIKNLNRYGLDVPMIYYICTYDLAKDCVPSFSVENYKLSTLCDYFGIEIVKEHDALSDMIASKVLFEILVDKYHIDIDTHVKKYIPCQHKEFTQFVSNAMLRKSICEFYGILQGISIDNRIDSAEVEYIKNWKKEYQVYREQEEIKKILMVIDKILEDGTISTEEVTALQASMREYLDLVSTSSVTLATQILEGILKGIIADGAVAEDECKKLREWLYENSYLSNHFPFNRAIALVEKALADSVLTKEESDEIVITIHEMLNPVESLRTQINSIAGKTVCLSGNFSYGSKADVEEYIITRGGVVDKSVKKTTNILVVGDCECQAYSNGTYGTKVKKAMEYNAKGCSIQIVKESDIIV